MSKILIVDDRLEDAESMASFLRAAGHSCVTETSSDRVISLLKADPYDLVILDVMLPRLSGFELCRRIRRDDALYIIPVLMVSAMGHEEEVLHGLAQGADDYLPKPFDAALLTQRVEALLRACAAAAGTDALTELPSAETIKREVQKRVSRQEIFALVYIQLLHLHPFSRRAGAAGSERAVRWLGRLLAKCGEGLGVEDIQVAHMGAGHFVSVLPAKHARAFCDYICRVWAAQLKTLYARAGQELLYEETLKAVPDANVPPLLDLLCCGAFAGGHNPCTAQQMFEVLTRLRQKVLETQRGGIYFDQRTWS